MNPLRSGGYSAKSPDDEIERILAEVPPEVVVAEMNVYHSDVEGRIRRFFAIAGAMHLAGKAIHLKYCPADSGSFACIQMLVLKG